MFIVVSTIDEILHPILQWNISNRRHRVKAKGQDMSGHL